MRRPQKPQKTKREKATVSLSKMAAAKEISADDSAAADLSELDGT